MPRPNSVIGLFRRLVVLRWKKLSLNAKLAVLAGALLVVGTVVSSALTCPASSGCCMRDQAPAVTQPAPAPTPEAHPVITEAGDSHGCPFSGQ